MENEILKIIAKYKPYSYQDIKNTYYRLDKSVDKTLLCIEKSLMTGHSLIDTSLFSNSK